MPDHDRLPKVAFEFLAELADHNDKAWFEANRERMETELVEPCRALVRTLTAGLQKPFPHIVGSDAKVGGSLTRMHRDVRFSKDKQPYHTHIGMHFWHSAGKKMAVPGFFLRLDPTEVLLGTGMHGPDKDQLQRIREAIAADPKKWRRCVEDPGFAKQWGGLDGESLKRVPAPWDASHPCAEDLRRKDFTGFTRLKPTQATRKGFADSVLERWKASRPLMDFLCRALGLPT